jgi:hypothetical protein
LGFLKKAPRQPMTEAFGADSLSLAMTINIEISETCPVRRMEQFGGQCKVDQDVGLCQIAIAGIA